MVLGLDGTQCELFVTETGCTHMAAQSPTECRDGVRTKEQRELLGVVQARSGARNSLVQVSRSMDTGLSLESLRIGSAGLTIVLDETRA